MSNTTVGKMGTKTAPNIGIKNYKILPSPREKSNTWYCFYIIYECIRLYLHLNLFHMEYCDHTYIHDISRSMHSLKYNKLSSLHIHLPHNLWQFVSKLRHSLNSAPKNIYLFDIHQTIWTVHARVLFYESSHQNAARLVNIMNSLRQNIVGCSTYNFPTLLQQYTVQNLSKMEFKLVYIAAKYSFIWTPYLKLGMG